MPISAVRPPAAAYPLSKQALEPVGGSVEQFDRLFREDYAKYARLVKELKITAN